MGKKAAPKKDAPKEKASVKTRMGALLEELESQKSQAKDKKPWLIPHHEWHIEQLNALLTAGVASLPPEVDEGLEYYLSQFDECDEETFYIDQELYAEAYPKEAAAEAAYARGEADAEARAAIAELESYEKYTGLTWDKVTKILRTPNVHRLVLGDSNTVFF